MHYRLLFIFAEAARPASVRNAIVCGLLCLCALCLLAHTAPTTLANQATIVLGDFANQTGDAIFEESLRQALQTAFDESPWFKSLSDVAFFAALKRKELSPAMPVTVVAVRDVCRQMHGNAYLTGSIERHAAGFVVSIRLADCASDQIIAQEQRTAEREEGVVDALGEAVRSLRVKAGEPAASVQKFGTPLSRAASPSLAALKAWSFGLKTRREKGAVAAIPFLSDAVKLDTQFASAIYDLGNAYRNAGEEAQARGLFREAFRLRQRAGVRKRLAIAGLYYGFVTVDEQKAVEAYTELIRTYPNDEKAVSNLGAFYGDVCRYEEAIAQFAKAAKMDLGDVTARENLVELLPAVGRFDDARAVYREILGSGLDDDSPHVNMYTIAFHQNDPKGMADQIAWFDGKPDLRHEILSEEADAAAYSGHLGRSRELTQQAVQSALGAHNKEQAALWLLNAAWREQFFGDSQLAHDETVRALTIAPESREGAAMAAILLARTGDVSRSKAVMNDLEKRYPDHKVVQTYWLPCIRAQIALKRRDAASALKELKIAAPLDMLYPQVMFYSHMPSVVLRAEAYLLSGQSARAADEWRRVLKAPGIVQLSATAPIARLQLARSSPGGKARAAYQDFLSLWKDADADIAVLKEARAEYSRLQ